jgi:hypothetical protein
LIGRVEEKAEETLAAAKEGVKNWAELKSPEDVL